MNAYCSNRSALGLVLAGYGAWMLLRPDRQPAIGPRLGLLGDVVAGALGGLTGGLAAFPGAAMVPWCALRGWPKDRQRAVFQPFILVMQRKHPAKAAVSGSSGGCGLLNLGGLPVPRQ